MLNQDALNAIFRNARTHSFWQNRPIEESTLRDIYDLAKMAPTSANSSPARFVFVRSPAAKEKLLQAVSPGNLEKTKTAPVTVVVAYDLEFYEKLPKLFPHTDARSWFVGNTALAEKTAFLNGTLQGAYLILAARSLGVDAGPMAGFDSAKVDELFFAGTKWKSNFLCNLGYGEHSKLFPRNPRLTFEEACQIL